MIALFTDFGSADLYVGQVKAVLARLAPSVLVIDLLHAVPNFQVRAGAHLLAALSCHIPDGCVCLAVVDPGVGGVRQPLVAEIDGKYFVGPDNGLLSVLAARAAHCRFWRIDWRPQKLSASFHGRDLFAPIAAALLSKAFPHEKLSPIDSLSSSLGADDLPEIVYIDHYGNAMTGLRARSHGAKLLVKGEVLKFASTFSEVPEGAAFWYENSLGLMEVASNCASIASRFGLVVGESVQIV